MGAAYRRPRAGRRSSRARRGVECADTAPKDVQTAAEVFAPGRSALGKPSPRSGPRRALEGRLARRAASGPCPDSHADASPRPPRRSVVTTRALGPKVCPGSRGASSSRRSRSNGRAASTDETGRRDRRALVGGSAAQPLAVATVDREPRLTSSLPQPVRQVGRSSWSPQRR